MSLVDSAWPCVEADRIVILPLGSTEQHGPHLPLDTDTVIATYVAARVQEALGAGAVVAPAIPYGSSGEHQAFAGTISIGTEALEHLLVEWVRSVSTWSQRLLIVNGHGGNIDAVEGAERRLVSEGRTVMVCHCAAPGMDAHAGSAETSIMLAIDPGRVRMHDAVTGNTAPLAQLLPRLRTEGVRAVAPSGVLGDPTSASSDLGHRLLEEMIGSILERVAHGWAPSG